MDLEWVESSDTSLLTARLRRDLAESGVEPGVGIAVLGADFRFQAMNPAARRLLEPLIGDFSTGEGVDGSPVPIGRYLFDGRGEPVPPERRPAAVAMATGVAQLGQIAGFAAVVAGGQLFTTWCLVDAYPIADEGGGPVRGAFLVLRDATPTERGARLTMDSLAVLAGVAEHGSDLILRRDELGCIDLALGDCLTITGYRTTELAGRAVLSLVHLDDQARWIEMDARPADASAPPGSSGGERPGQMVVGPWSEPYRIVRADGSIVWVESRTSSSAAWPDKIFQATRDITERILVLQRLQANEERLRLVVDNASDLVAKTSPSSEIEWVSTSATGVFGWHPDQLIGRNVRDFVHPADLVRNDEVIASLDRGVREEFELRVRCADGEYRWIQAIVRSILDDEGVVTGRVSIWRDIQAERQARVAWDELQARYLVLARHASDVVWQTDAVGRCTWVSPSVTSVLGWLPEEWIGVRFRSRCHPDDEQSQPALDGRLAGGSGASRVEARIQTKAGAWRWMSTVAAAVETDPDGRLVQAVIGARDIHDEVQTRHALEASEDLFRSTIMHAPNPIALADIDARFVAANQAMCTLLQRDEQWLLGRHMCELIHPDEREGAVETIEQMVAGTLHTHVAQRRYVRADGATLWTKRSLSLIPDSFGQPSYFIAQLEDETEAHEANLQLAYLAHHDELTGLHNRAWVLDAIETSLAGAAESGATVGVLFIDLDHFKVVNDSLGHAAGDEVLQTIAARLAEPLTGGEHLGRLGGDEFVVVVPGRSVVELERLAAELLAALAIDLTIGGHRIVPSASIGIALSQPGATSASILRDADVALYRAKEGGRSRWQLFDDAMHASALRRLTLEDEIRRGLEADEFTVHLQPIVLLEDSSIVGFEALVRWAHPGAGLLSPAAFLGLAEETGLIVPIGLRVFDLVCELLGRYPELPGRVSVNVSAVQLARVDLVGSFTEIMARHHTDAGRLNIEVTETAVLSLLDSVRSDLAALRAAGVGIHVDDFGTGYSSIALLRELPVTGLKLDKSFVADLTTQASAANVLAAGLVGLANGLGLESVAEGVETPAQAARLLTQGWKYGQGYHFGRPAPVEHWVRVLRHR